MMGMLLYGSGCIQVGWAESRTMFGEHWEKRFIPLGFTLNYYQQ